MSGMEIFFESAGLLILFSTAAIVFWYTRETVRMRRVAQEQNTLIAEQVRIAQRTHELEIERVSRETEKERSLLDPVLVFRGGTSGGGKAKMNFINNGGSIKKISVEPCGDFRISISPPDSIHTGGNGAIMLSKLSSSEEHSFKLRYQNAVGEERVKVFSRHNGRFDESNVQPECLR